MRSVGADHVVGEGTQAGDDVGIDADAGSVFGEGDVADVVAAVFDAPVAAYPLAPLFGGATVSRGHPEDNFGRRFAKAGFGVAPANRALQSQDGVDELFPGRTAKPRLGREYRQLTSFPTVSARTLARGGRARLAARRSEFEFGSQGRLVVLDLRQQVIAGGDRALESFFDSARR